MGFVWRKTLIQFRYKISPTPFLLSVKGNVFLGGIIGALGLALFVGSLLGAVYSFVLALVLSHIADAEEEDLRARFGKEMLSMRRGFPSSCRVSKILIGVGIRF